jgi:KRAB domain-containing zinc finger protein
MKSEENSIAICPECFKICKNSKKLKNHLKRNHRKEPKNELVKVETVTGPKHSTNICPECLKVCSSKKHLNTHMKRRHCANGDIKLTEIIVQVKTETFECSECFKSCNSEKHLRTHMKRRHVNEVELSESKLLEPEIKVEEAKTFICSKCLKSCSSAKHLQKHTERRHTTPKNPLKVILKLKSPERFQCLECDKNYSTLKTLKRHQKLHEQGKSKSFQCQICLQVLCDPSSLKNHISRIHDKTFRYHCNDCGKGFFSVSDRDLHEVVHKPLEERERFLCTLCSAPFLRKKDMKDHKKHCSEATNIIYHDCPQCDASFKTKKYLIGHVQGGRLSDSCQLKR